MDKKLLKLTDGTIAEAQDSIISKQEELIEILKNRLGNYEKQIKVLEELAEINNNKGAPDGRNDCGVNPI